MGATKRRSHLLDAKDKVVIVDADRSTLRLIRRGLKSRAIDFSTTTTARAALTLASKNPRIIFVEMDLGEDQEDGITLVRKIRSRNTTVPICMLTSDQSASALFDSFMAGADQIICKCFERPGMVEGILDMVDAFTVGRTPPANLENFRDSILKLRGISDAMLIFLTEYVNNDMPDIAEFSRILGTTKNSIVKRFTRIQERLKLRNRAGLVRLLTVIGFVYQSRWG